MKFITLLMGGLILSTAAIAVEGKETLVPAQAVEQKHSAEDQLKQLQDKHNENTIFDDATSGKSNFSE